ncbi:hypothetical protein [Microbacterium gorillae]|uniref:hypothetical protein n=1 Tax=Microbacterium gorillae TaxID=1231063 RepID=UPI003D991529
MAQAQERSFDAEIHQVLASGLKAEYLDAIDRAQSFLVSVREGRLPRHLSEDPALVRVSAEDLSYAIERWVEILDKPLEGLRVNTNACAHYRNSMSTDAQINFCAQVARAEHGLIDSLHEMIELEEDD